MSRHSPGVPLEASSALIGGMPVFGGGGGIPLTFGTVYFVDSNNGNDSFDGLTMDTAFATISKAYSMVTTNNHDVIALSANSAHALTNTSGTAPLKVTKNRVHFVGLGGGSRYYGQRTRITMGVTTGTTTCILENTGVGNTFTNIKFDSSDTLSTSIYAVVEAGEYAQYTNCEFYKSTDLDQTGAAEVVCNGDSAYFLNCTFGSNANAIVGAIIRPCVLLTKGIVTGKVSRDVTFENCMFWRKFGDVANRFVYGANATDVERMMLFKSCVFWGAKLSTAVPDQNVALGATQTEGDILLWNCSSIRAATAMSTTTGVFVDSPVPAAATSGISLQAS